MHGLIALGLVGLLVTGIVALTDSPSSNYDDTDDQANRIRSGLSVYTDHLTGCQYIGLRKHALTPRLDPQGNPICKPKPVNIDK